MYNIAKHIQVLQKSQTALSAGWASKVLDYTPNLIA